MPFSDFTPPPAPDAVVDTTVSGTCQMCDQPSTATGLCRYHYFVEAVDGRGKQWAKLRQRPGKWLPPLIAVAVLGALFAVGPPVVGAMVILLVLMFGWVFGFKQRPQQQDDHHWYDISGGYR